MAHSRSLLAQVLALALSAGLLVTGCGGDDEGTIPGSQVPCSPSQITLQGSARGQAVDASYDFTSSAFDQFSQPHSYEVSFRDADANQGLLRLTWSEMIPEDTPSEVGGALTMPAEGGVPTAALEVESGSMLTNTSEGLFYFSLDLSDGTIDGCVDTNDP